MAYDIIVKDARIVDGTGKKAYGGDVALRDGRIAAVGKVSGGAKRTIAADGQVAAPGFIDAHTHYDAQLLWDPSVDPSTAHGVTTILMGNCGFTLAPVKPKDQDYLLGLFSATEEVPKSALRKYAPLAWETFSEYLSCLERSALGVNVLTQVGHSAVRRYVMGENALERAATDEEIAAMVRVAEDAMDAGAAGVSTSYSPHHVGELGEHIPSYFATDAEAEALAAAVRRAGKRLLSINPRSKREGLSEEDRTLLVRLAEISGAVVSWNDLGAGSPNWESALEFMEGEIRRGHEIYVVARCQPAETRFTLSKLSPLFSGSQPWLEYCRLDHTGKMAALADPTWRARLAEYWNAFPYMSLASVEKADSPATRPLVGRRLVDIAQERGVRPTDVLFDVAREDALETFFLLSQASKDDESDAERLLKSPATLVGISDGGAHLQTFAGADYPTYFLKHWVREKRTFTLEEGVAALTSRVADFVGLRDRGTLEVGKAADLVLFDAGRVEPQSLRTLDDIPGGGVRLAKGARGISWVIVNGVPIVENDKPTGAIPGRLLRASS